MRFAVQLSSNQNKHLPKLSTSKDPALPKAELLDYRTSKINGRLRVAKLPKCLELDLEHFRELSGATVLLIGSAEDCIHSVYRSTTVLTNGYWDVMGCLPCLIPAGGVVGIYGLGAGTVARLIHEYYPDQKMKGWEIDEDIVELGRKHMELNQLEVSNTLEVVIDDCFADSGKIPQGFTGLIVDVFLDNEVHPSLSEVAFWKMLKSRLHPNGRLIGNVDPPQLHALNEAFSGECQWHVHSESSNLLVFTGSYPTEDDWTTLPADLKRLGLHLDWNRGRFDEIDEY